MTLRETIASILTDASGTNHAPDIAERLLQAENDVANHLRVACRWIDQGLISEPVGYSEDLGNLVQLSVSLDDVRSRLIANGFALPETGLPDDLADRLNAHYVKAADMAPLLDRLRRTCLLDQGPLARMRALRAIRRAFPRERRFHDEITATEDTLIPWVESPDRSRKDIDSLLDFMGSYQARSGRLKKIVAELVERRSNLRATELRSEILVETAALEEGGGTSEDTTGEILAKIDTLRSIRSDAPEAEIDRIKARLEQRRRDAVEITERQERAVVAIAALERALDEKVSVGKIENLYATARKEAGTLASDLEARVRRRLEIERSVRIRRVGSIVIAVVTVASLATWWFVTEEKKAERRQVVEDVLLSAEEAMTSHSYEEVAQIVSRSSRSSGWIPDDPRVIAALTSAQEAIQTRDDSARSTCASLRSIADQVERDEMEFTTARRSMEALILGVPESAQSLISTCQTEAVERIDRVVAVLLETEADAIQAAIDSAEIRKTRITGRWRELGRRFLLVPDAYEKLTGDLESILRDLELAARRSPELKGLQPVRWRVERLVEETKRDLARVQSDQSVLSEGLIAIRSTLSPRRSEIEYADAIRSVMRDHAGTLEDIGRFSTFESTAGVASSLIPLQAWRDRFATRVRDAMDPEATRATRAAGLSAADAFLKEFPDSMLESDLQLIRDLLNLDLEGSEVVGARIADDLDSAGLNDLRRFETMNGWVYARPLENGRRWRYLRSIADLGEPAESLLRKPPVATSPGSRPVRSEASLALERGMSRLRAASGLTGSRVLLETLRDVRSGGELDPHVALTILDLSWQAWKNAYGDLDPEGDKVVTQWLDRIHDLEREVVTTDWVATAPRRRDRPGRDRDARILVKSSPDPDRISTRMTQRAAELRYAIQPVLPVGLAIPTPKGTAPRVIRWLDDVAYESDLAVPVRIGDRVVLQPATLDSEGRLLPTPGLPPEAILIFRTSRPGNQS